MSTQATQYALVVEDDAGTADVLEHTLATAGFTVVRAADGPSALAAVAELDPDLVTLDVGLPGMDGTEVCRRIRESSDCYVVMISARRDEIDRLIALEAGADDFLVKPCSPRELRARVTALFRRPRRTAVSESAPATAGRRLDGGAGLIVDLSRREVRIGQTDVQLTRTEFDLLAHLASQAGTVCPREDVLRAVWNTSFADAQHLIDVHMANLRRKLRSGDRNTRWIHTVRGVGYRFDQAVDAPVG